MQLSMLGAAMATYTSFLWENVSTDKDSVDTKWSGMKSGQHMVKSHLSNSVLHLTTDMLQKNPKEIPKASTLCKT